MYIYIHIVVKVRDPSVPTWLPVEVTPPSRCLGLHLDKFVSLSFLGLKLLTAGIDFFLSFFFFVIAANTFIGTRGRDSSKDDR